MQLIITNSHILKIDFVCKIFKNNGQMSITIYYYHNGIKEKHAIIFMEKKYLQKAYNYLAKNINNKKIDLRRF